MQASERLAGRVALVTGASRGIGRALALALAGAGADVVVAAKTETPDPRLPGTILETARAIEALGRRALAVPVDLRDGAAAEALARRALEAFGRVDLLVNNAGAVHFGDIADWTLKRFDLVMSINARASFILCRELMPALRASDGGTVVMISPPVHAKAAPHKAPYLASKIAMTMIAHAIAVEEKDRGVSAFSLWPAAMIETAATIRHGLGEPAQWRKPEIVCDALLALLARPPAEVTGRAWTDEEALAASGVTDFSPWSCVPGTQPPPLSLQWVSE